MAAEGKVAVMDLNTIITESEAGSSRRPTGGPDPGEVSFLVDEKGEAILKLQDEIEKAALRDGKEDASKTGRASAISGGI